MVTIQNVLNPENKYDEVIRLVIISSCFLMNKMQCNETGNLNMLFCDGDSKGGTPYFTYTIANNIKFTEIFALDGNHRFNILTLHIEDSNLTRPILQIRTSPDTERKKNITRLVVNRLRSLTRGFTVHMKFLLICRAQNENLCSN